ncbi:sterol desaturase family protein [Lichenicoccus roseus]|uniref:Sterol desaturase family protein n=1 Tax=Lichenicoccus roseus TaxID=2683649 RepID=A0A5R9J7X2_9PROT|nr:sterol desaturase family protein [Lichenicoccus roseus]TLU72617.1 sterol desaturase family protein [Lichenicoccus roseus]
MYKRWRKHGRSFDLGRMSLRDLITAYGSHPAVHLYVLLATASGIYAVHAAHGLRPDGLARLGAAIVVTILAYPLTWYVLHRFILHGRFLYRWRMTSSLWKRIHFDHHQDPHRMDVLFGSPLNTAPTILAILVPLGWLIGGGAAGAAASVCAGFLITCLYEFCHCVQHLNFKPRNRLLRRMKELHLAHHFHDEEGNYGITSFAIDRMFGTFYGSVRERPRSPHVFNLGYDLNEAERYPWVAELSGGPPMDRPPGHRRPGNRTPASRERTRGTA